MLNPTSTPLQTGDDAKMTSLNADLVKKAQLGIDTLSQGSGGDRKLSKDGQTAESLE